MPATDKIHVSEQWTLVTGVSAGAAGAARVAEQWALVAGADAGAAGAVEVAEQWVVYAGTRVADYANSAEQWIVLAARGDEVATPQVSEQWILLVTDDTPPTTPIGSWTYEFDGHLFYGLNLGLQGTAVFDVITGRWSDWRSGTLPWLNVNLSVVWQDQTYAATLFDPNLVKFDPASVLDDGFRVNTFVSSGRLEYQERAFASMPEVQIFGSIGLEGGDVTLRYSNDDGASWSSDRTRTVAQGARGDNVVFYDLGSLRSPGRLFEIEDAGTLRRIGALQAKLTGVASSDDGQ